MQLIADWHRLDELNQRVQVWHLWYQRLLTLLLMARMQRSVKRRRLKQVSFTIACSRSHTAFAGFISTFEVTVSCTRTCLTSLQSIWTITAYCAVLIVRPRACMLPPCDNVHEMLLHRYTALNLACSVCIASLSIASIIRQSCPLQSIHQSSTLVVLLLSSVVKHL